MANFALSLLGLPDIPDSIISNLDIADANPGGAVTANDDEYTVPFYSNNNRFNVLENDLPADGSVRIVGVTVPSEGGTIEIGEDQASILYRPDDGFVGEEVFDYTIANEEGASDVASVRVTVEESVSDSPIQFRLEAIDRQGKIVENILVDEPLTLNVRVRDARPTPVGIRAAHADVVFSSDTLSYTGPIRHGPMFSAERSGTAPTSLT